MRILASTDEFQSASEPFYCLITTPVCFVFGKPEPETTQHNRGEFHGMASLALHFPNRRFWWNQGITTDPWPPSQWKELNFDIFRIRSDFFSHNFDSLWDCDECWTFQIKSPVTRFGLLVLVCFVCPYILMRLQLSTLLAHSFAIIKFSAFRRDALNFCWM